MSMDEYKAISMQAEVCIAVDEIERTRFSMSEKKELTVHETEVRRLKLRIEAEEDILKEAKKLLEE